MFGNKINYHVTIYERRASSHYLSEGEYGIYIKNDDSNITNDLITDIVKKYQYAHLSYYVNDPELFYKPLFEANSISYKSYYSGNKEFIPLSENYPNEDCYEREFGGTPFSCIIFDGITIPPMYFNTIYEHRYKLYLKFWISVNKNQYKRLPKHIRKNAKHIILQRYSETNDKKDDEDYLLDDDFLELVYNDKLLDDFLPLEQQNLSIEKFKFLYNCNKLKLFSIKYDPTDVYMTISDNRKPPNYLKI